MSRGCPAPTSPCSMWEFPVWASWWEAELLPIMEAKPGVAFPAAFAVKAHLGLANQGHCLGLEPEEAERWGDQAGSGDSNIGLQGLRWQ